MHLPRSGFGSGLFPRTLFLEALATVGACAREVVAPGAARLVAVRIIAAPERDTVVAGDTLRLAARSDSLPAPARVRWTVTPRGDTATSDTFLYTAESTGNEYVRAIADFEDGAVGSATRRFFVRRNAAPVVEIVALDSGNYSRTPVGATLLLVATVSDPDGDSLAGVVQWMLERSGARRAVASGDTLRFVADSVGTLVVAAEARDVHGARSTARLPLRVYDPITPYVWRVRASEYGTNIISEDLQGRILAHSGIALEAFTPAGQRVWSVASGAAAPAAIGPSGDIYVARPVPGELVGVSPGGVVLWVVGPDADGSGPEAGPAVLEDGSTAVLAAITSYDARTLWRVSASGAVLWRVPLDSLRQGGSVAVARDGTIYVAGSLLCCVSPLRGILYAISSDGQLKWFGMFPTGGSVVVADDSTILVTGDSLRAFRPDGSLRWAAAFSGTIVGNNAVFVTSGNAVAALSLAAGAGLWSSAVANPQPVALSADGSLLVASGTDVIALDAASGAERWRHQFAGQLRGVLLTSAGLVIGSDGAGYLEAVASGSGPVDSPWPQLWATPQRTSRVRR